MKAGKVFLSAVLAGMSIGFGGLVFLSVETRVVGAALFTIGLFVVCTFGFHLYTGKVCYVFENGRAYACSIPLIWLGNLAGTGLVAALASMTRQGPGLPRTVPKTLSGELRFGGSPGRKAGGAPHQRRSLSAGAYLDSWAAVCAEFYLELAETYGVMLQHRNSIDAEIFRVAPQNKITTQRSGCDFGRRSSGMSAL